MLSKTPENNSNTTIHSRGHNASIELVVFTKSNGPLTTGWRVERTGAAKQGKAPSEIGADRSILGFRVSTTTTIISIFYALSRP